VKKNFDVFKKECLYWQKKLELGNYDIEIKLGTDKDFFSAWCSIYADYNAIVWMDETYKFSSLQEVKDAAKHEMVHILVGRLVDNARARYINKNEIDEALEELVRKLTKLI